MNHSTFEDFANKKALQYCTGDQRHQVIAVLVKGGKVVNFGYSQLRYSKNRSYFYASLHAEQNLIERVSAEELFGSKVYVYRFNNSSSPTARQAKCSIPCPLCQHSLKKCGVSRICCLDNNGSQLILKNRDLIELSDEPDSLTNRYLDNKIIHDKFYPKEFML